MPPVPTPRPTFFVSPTLEPTSSFTQKCALPTPEADVNTEEALEASVMLNRTVFFSADIYLSATLYVLVGVNDRLNFDLDGKGLWKLDGQDSVRCLFIGSGVRMGLKDLTITNGYAAYYPHGASGGGIFVGSGAVLKMDGCTVSSSRTASYGQGAGIYVDEATLILVNTVIEFNVMYYGKGAGVYLTSSSVLTMAGGSLNYNFAQSSGCYTTATMEGGGLYIAGGAFATITDGASIADNIAYRGGGVYVASYGELVLQNVSVIGNSYTKVYLGSTYTSWYRSSCSTANAYQSYGGGIYADSNTKVTVVWSTIKSNAAYYYGGGIYFSSGDSVSIADSKLSSNYAGHRGGGIYSTYAIIVFNHSMFDSNTLAGTSSR